MAKRWGERRMFTFVTLTKRGHRTYDQAAKAAFGKTFRQVDDACSG